MNDFNDDKLLADAAKLRTEISPERDLWPDIEASITTPEKKAWSPMFAQAAAVVILVAGSSGLTYMAVKDDGAAENITVAPQELFHQQTAFGDSYSLGPSFTDARGGLASKLETQLQKLSPEERNEVEENLGMIRGAIDEINAELAKDPDNARLQALLLKAYREELTIMRRVGSLTQNVTSRNDI